METRIKKFLDQNRVCALTVVSPDGTLESAAMHYTHKLKPLEFYFSTDVNSRKCAAVRVGKTATASVVVGFSEEDWQTMQMTGKLARVSGKELAAVKKLIYKKNPQAKKYEDDPDTFFLKFTPRQWRFSDFSKHPPKVVVYETRHDSRAR